jgi:hypothetical protein
MTFSGGVPPTGNLPINGRFSGGVAPMTASPTMMQPQFSSQAPQVAVAREALRLPAAAALQRCYKWLEQAVNVAPQLVSLMPPLLTAVQLYEAEHYQACLAQTAGVMQVIAQLQASIPMLPQL